MCLDQGKSSRKNCPWPLKGRCGVGSTCGGTCAACAASTFSGFFCPQCFAGSLLSFQSTGESGALIRPIDHPALNLDLIRISSHQDHATQCARARAQMTGDPARARGAADARHVLDPRSATHAAQKSATRHFPHLAGTDQRSLDPQKILK